MYLKLPVNLMFFPNEEQNGCGIEYDELTSKAHILKTYMRGNNERRFGAEKYTPMLATSAPSESLR